MRHVFLDTNTVIDFLSARQPFAKEAGQLIAFGFHGHCKLYMSAASMATVYYLLRKLIPHKYAIGQLDELSTAITIAEVTGEEVKKAINSGFADFEDALQYYTALRLSNINCIITRNPRDFKKSSLPIMSPKEIVNILMSEA